ncbi:hypothetical protein [Sporosarcina sp. Te-1]|uniref:hypothetical protein n=1 Tax=Sporosarcina sp. Te-1 TaxID=2818390 RepID=UPI001A9D8B12|nr:hypothetical protein [Sporosarcina sp. Te-1]QTD40599.1 hypothetical protein J3U78_17810 [Sporosarcina sp. Te-1]
MTEKQNESSNRISLKAFTVNQLGTLIDKSKELGDNHFQILVLTSYGFIKGDLFEISSAEELLTPNPEASPMIRNFSVGTKSYRKAMKRICGSCVICGR